MLFYEKCHIDINNIIINDKNTEFKEFITNMKIKIESLSIRDIIDTINNFDLRKKDEHIPYYRSYRLASINSFTMFLIIFKRLDIDINTTIDCFLKCNQYDLINCIGINWGLLDENNTLLGQTLFIFPNHLGTLTHKVNIHKHFVKDYIYTDIELDIKKSDCYSEIIKNQLPTDLLKDRIQQIMNILKKHIIL